MLSINDQVAPRLHLLVDEDAKASVTRGLMGDTNFAVLPNVSPTLTFALTFVTQVPVLLALFWNPASTPLLHTITLCAFSAFLFGWHVHEKAILLVLIPFT